MWVNGGFFKAATLDGKLVGGSNGGMIEGIGLNIGNGNFVVDQSGNLTLNGSITWGRDTFPVQSQFSVDGSTNWHSTQTANDKYRRDKQYDGTWGTAYQFRGTDGANGRPGSDANVPSYIKSTYIDSVEIRSPTIKANDYYIYPINENDYDGSFNIYGMQAGGQFEFFTISYVGQRDGAYGPKVYMYSKGGADICIGTDGGTMGMRLYLGGSEGMVFIEGELDLSGCTVTNWGNNRPTAVFA